MKTVNEIIEYIDEADTWTAAKEEGLICRMGGGKMINGRFHVTGGYKKAVKKLNRAYSKMGRRGDDTSWEEFQEEITNMFA